jgi:hypothetical protein
LLSPAVFCHLERKPGIRQQPLCSPSALRTRRCECRKPGRPSVTDFPQTLADTGAFASLATLTPQPGIIPFELNVPLWSDGAHKTRWFCLPARTGSCSAAIEGGWLRSGLCGSNISISN